MKREKMGSGRVGSAHGFRELTWTIFKSSFVCGIGNYAVKANYSVRSPEAESASSS